MYDFTSLVYTTTAITSDCLTTTCQPVLHLPLGLKNIGPLLSAMSFHDEFFLQILLFGLDNCRSV